jgi:hypothetical protein
MSSCRPFRAEVEADADGAAFDDAPAFGFGSLAGAGVFDALTAEAAAGALVAFEAAVRRPMGRQYAPSRAS